MNTNSKTLTTEQLSESLFKLQNWVEDHNYRGYEPFDGLSSWFRPLAFGNELLERILQQLIRQCPFNIRPLMGVQPQDSTKGRGYMAWGYLTLYRIDHQLDHLNKAKNCLEWLDQHKVPRFTHHSWSNHFDFVSRGGRYTSNDPIIVWTSLIGHAYIEAYEATNNDWFLRIAESACNWILELPREKTSKGDCISYLADRQLSIHNANMLGASILARTAKHNGNSEYLSVARSAMEYSCLQQHSDGSWWYAEDPQFHWIDNFHTGYNLDSLKYYIDATGDNEFYPMIERGLRYFMDNFFEPNGRPKYYHNRTYPVDIQCAAQAIDTLSKFGNKMPECIELAKKVALWTINNMQDKQGYFYYREYPLIKSKIPMLHWGQATMFKALTNLYLCLQNSL
ncbi:glycoside hydrolase family protein [Methylobacter psychrophilus]|uniref:hypothetical protein n=1 Tax=Methylobacter psychrophilus TaxID=96941 RepID=UPI0021D4A10E|nr:hypothetical protein [Methylobacter psychrophilus]